MWARWVVGAVLSAAGLAGCGGGDGPDPAETGWQLTVYYTPVERYHEGTPRRVVGCRQAVGCERGDDVLGRYPGDFVDAVELEGNGRLTSGDHAGLVLNWSAERGFWLDTVPRDAAGGVLRPFVSVGAEPDVLRSGTRFRVEDCGQAADGTEVADEVCDRISDARWLVGEPLPTGTGGAKHLDIYVGEESSDAFTDSGWYTTLVDVELAL